MAIQGTTLAYVRPGGDQLHGGLFDPAISGAGTNYANQDAAQLSLSDLATSGAGSTTLTSATGGFTSAMVGNAIRIASGTNFQAGYYFVTVFTNGNTVTLDRTPSSGGAGSGGVGRLGGAFASMQNFRSGGDLPQPAIAASALVVPGMTIYKRGAGTDDPANASVDYDYDGGYAVYPAGNQTAGCIRLIGVNGRPNIHVSPLLGYTTDHWYLENLKLVCNATAYASEGFWIGQAFGKNLYIENGGNDIKGWRGAKGIENSRFLGTGAASTADNRAAIEMGDYGGLVSGCFIKGWRASGIHCSMSAQTVFRTVVKNCGRDGLYMDSGSVTLGATVIGSVFDGNGRDNIRITNSHGLACFSIFNSILSNAGAYGFNCAFGSAAANELLINKKIGKNNFHNNTSGNYANLNARADDTTLDPQFVDRNNDDYRVGANMRAIGYPSSFPGMHANSINYEDIGAFQRVEPGTRAASLINGGLVS